jgi:hypothetical protein
MTPRVISSGAGMISRQCQKLQIPEKSWGRSESQGSSNLEQKVKPGRTCGSWGLLRSHRVLNMYICSPPPRTAECFSEGHFAVKFQGSSEKSWALSSGLCCFDLQNYLSVALANLGIWQRLLGPSRCLKSEEWFLLISTKDLSGPKDSAGLKTSTHIWGFFAAGNSCFWRLAFLQHLSYPSLTWLVKRVGTCWQSRSLWKISNIG